MSSAALVWFRRDLRDFDHAALSQALQNHSSVFGLFVFDTDILNALPSRFDRRVAFIWDAVQDLDQAFARHRGQARGGLVIRHGSAVEMVLDTVRRLGVSAVYANTDEEPAALGRDQVVAEQLRVLGVAFHQPKDHVFYGPQEVLSQAGQTFSVFTAYQKAWLNRLTGANGQVPTHPVLVTRLVAQWAPAPAFFSAPSHLADLGFESTDLSRLNLPLGMQGGEQLLTDFLRRIDAYGTHRDFPARKGPSYLSTHLRFGTVSIRRLVNEAVQRMNSPIEGEGARKWLGELIWRDFFHMILAHHPHVVDHAFQPVYEQLCWDDNPVAFSAWCEGKTGYPLVDAGMRQLRASGYMHNRLRMVTASFLTKHLGIDWRQGQAYFAQHLLDFDLAANNGGWQWVASTGCDAQPYFRLFNPVLQSEKYDPDGQFIRRYVPELANLPNRAIHAPWLLRPIERAELGELGFVLGRDYPEPIVDHALARQRTLARFAAVKQKSFDV
jgi:deoxyribodipyrimidine photo-lyase